jgi:signal peptidase I
MQDPSENSYLETFEDYPVDENSEFREKQSSKFGNALLELFQIILMAVVLYVLIDSVIARVRVENISMKPTLQPGEFLMVNKLIYRFDEVERGDIVVFHNPNNTNEDYIKRVIGLPGDIIEAKEAEIFVNGFALDEEYIAEQPIYSGIWEVPDDEIFVLGDNRNQSSDSHVWGFVPMENVVGKAIAIYWPFNEMRVLNDKILISEAEN